MEKVNKKADLVTLVEAAYYARVQRGALYLAVRLKKLKAYKVGKKWMVSLQDVDEYRLNKYNPQKRKVSGQLVYDFDKGFYSVEYTAKIISDVFREYFPPSKVYYLIRLGEILVARKGKYLVISKDEIQRYIEKEHKRREEKDRQINFA